MMHDGITNNKASDEKESPPGKETEGNLKLHSCKNNSIHDSICFRYITFQQPKQLIELFYTHPQLFPIFLQIFTTRDYNCALLKRSVQYLVFVFLLHQKEAKRTRNVSEA